MSTKLGCDISLFQDVQISINKQAEHPDRSNASSKECNYLFEEID